MAETEEVKALRDEIADLRRREEIIVYYLNHLLPTAWARDLIRDLEGDKTLAQITKPKG